MRNQSSNQPNLMAFVAPPRHLLTLVCFAAVLAGVRAAPAVTPEGAYAVTQVSQTSYEHIHGDLLFTHDGHDRGYGAEHDLARNSIQAAFLSYGLITSLQGFQYGGTTYYNVVGEFVGTTRADEIYIVGAHYDSVNNPGADDNASGTAAVVELARLISQWASAATIRFIAFDREEQGLHGSAACANACATAGENVRGMISLDMIAYRYASENQALIYGRSPLSDSVKLGLAAALNDHVGVTTTDEGTLDASDHAPFEWNGFPAALLIEADVWDNPFYHEQADSVDTPGYIDYPYAVTLTRGTMGWLVDAAGVVPDHPHGDANCDYAVDFDDINPFVMALVSEAGYVGRYPDCPFLTSDCNNDGSVDFDDINPFVALLAE